MSVFDCLRRAAGCGRRGGTFALVTVGPAGRAGGGGGGDGGGEETAWEVDVTDAPAWVIIRQVCDDARFKAQVYDMDLRTCGAVFVAVAGGEEVELRGGMQVDTVGGRKVTRVRGRAYIHLRIGVSIAAAFTRQPDGGMPLMFHAIMDSAVFGVAESDSEEAPVRCAAVFISPTRALTAYRYAGVPPKVGTVLAGVSSPAYADMWEKSVRRWTLKVVAASHVDDGLVLLETVSGPTPTHVLPLATPGKPLDSIRYIRGSEVWLATWGTTVRMVKGAKMGSYWQPVSVYSASDRHFAYYTTGGGRDVGGAVVSRDGRLVGLHLGGWDLSSPPPAAVTEVLPAAAAAATPMTRARAAIADRAAADAAAARAENTERAVAMGIAGMGASTQMSIMGLAWQRYSGGYAVYLASPSVAALCTAPSSDSSGRNAAAAAAEVAAAPATPATPLRHDDDDDDGGVGRAAAAGSKRGGTEARGGGGSSHSTAKRARTAID